MKIAVGCLAALLLVAGAAPGQRRSSSQGAPGQFDYYMLVLSYAPDFCAEPGGQKDPRECGSGRHVGFAIGGVHTPGLHGAV